MSYIASLNLLNTESPAPPSEDTFSDDLSLWANAQFTFDSAPGSALLEDDKKEENEKLFASLTDFTIENQQQQEQDESSNYLSSDYLLSQLQQHAPTPTTPITQTHMGLPRLAPAPTEQQLQHQLQNQQHEHHMNAVTVPNSHASKEKGGGFFNHSTNNNKRSLNDDSLDQPLSSGVSAVEDDKRRRNTAASARFRQKKKLREQALEQTAKEMSTKCETLDKRVRELELEAKWLRALVVEKNPSLLADRSGSSSESSESSSECGGTDDSIATAKNS